MSGIDTGIEQIRDAAPAQVMGRKGLDLRLGRPGPKDGVNRLVGHGPDDDAPGLGDRAEQRASTVPTYNDPRRHRLTGAVVDVGDPLFVAFAFYYECPGLRVVVRNYERDDLGTAEPSGV